MEIMPLTSHGLGEAVAGGTIFGGLEGPEAWASSFWHIETVAWQSIRPTGSGHLSRARHTDAVKQTFLDTTDRSQLRGVLCPPPRIECDFMLCPEAATPPRALPEDGVLNAGSGL